MKKLVVIVLFMVLIPNIYAKEYTPFKFESITNSCIPSSLVKCEKIKYNKFYEEVIDKYIYEDETFKSDDYPFVDKNDTKIITSDTISPTGNVENYLYRINFGYEIDSISFENIDNTDLIKLYYNDEEFSDYEIHYNGRYLEYKFNYIINPKLLKIVVDTSSIKDYILRLKLNNDYINQSNVNASDNTLTVNMFFKDTDEYKEFLNELNLDLSSYKFSVKYYNNNTILYKHYSVVKNYYKDLTSDYIEGYKYDEEESYYLYKKYIRNEINTKIITNNIKTYYAKPLSSDNSNKNIVDELPKIYKSKTNIKRYNLGKPNIYNKLNEKVSPIKKNYTFFLLIIICIISLRFVYVKFNYKNEA